MISDYPIDKWQITYGRVNNVVNGGTCLSKCTLGHIVNVIVHIKETSSQGQVDNRILSNIVPVFVVHSENTLCVGS